MADRAASDPQPATTTFVATGIERMAPLWEIAPEAAAAAMDRHGELLQSLLGAGCGGFGEGGGRRRGRDVGAGRAGSGDAAR